MDVPRHGPATESATPEGSDPPTADAVTASPASRRGLSLLGAGVSVLALGAVAWWAVHQPAPSLPSTSGELLALAGAVAIYAVGTTLRAERWRALLADAGARPTRADAFALTCVGYMGNSVLPARAGDAMRVLLMAPRAGAGVTHRAVIGTLVAERVLDVVVLVVLFVVVGWGLLGAVGAGSVEAIAVIAVAVAAGAPVAWMLVRRNDRVHSALAPLAAATLNLRRARHGPAMLLLTLAIWALETACWMATAAAVSFHMNPVEGVYLVALASVFSLIPSGPAYAGTQDAAIAIGTKAIGGSGATAVAYLLMLRLVLVVPITIAGLVLLAVRYGGLARLRRLRTAEVA